MAAEQHALPLASNGSTTEPRNEPLLPSGFRRSDVVRLMCQCLNDLGYLRAARALEEESGFAVLSDSMASLRAGILVGEWSRVEAEVEQLQLLSKSDKLAVRFLIYRQKYLELLEAGRAQDALHCLREQLAPLETQGPLCALLHAHRRTPDCFTGPFRHATRDAIPARADTSVAGTSTTEEQRGGCRLGLTIGELSACLLCADAEELHAQMGWDGAAGSSRRQLLHELQPHIPPSVLLPEHRLQTLLQQAVLWQTNQSMFTHAALCGQSLFEDLCSSADDIPRETVRVLEKHSDEVWFVKFSHNGEMLASASKDRIVVVWDVRAPKMPHKAVLSGHTNALSFVAWSPDDECLLTCGADRLLKLWRVQTGECLRTFAKHTETVTACAWLPDGRHFVSAGVDKNVFLWSVARSEVVQAWRGPRITDLAVSHTGSLLIGVCANKVRLCSLSVRADGTPHMDTDDEHGFDEVDSITSLSLSNDSRYLLVNVASEEIHAWDLNERHVLHKYRGQKQGRFIIRSAFGGVNDAFVVSGSEDSQVYIWHRHNSALLEVLPGHSGTVNAVAWNPCDPHMFASCSDDHTVRVWGLPTGPRPPAA
uniref:CTLH domain-containing protein n=1 Tax=Calcidiscus leptoporus TaxID=127549 RepID=A0A7S0INT6_9EUKA